MRLFFTRAMTMGALIFMGTQAYGWLDAPQGVYIRSLNYGGSGCPQGSVGQTIAQDRNSFTLIFDDYIAEVGRGISRRQGRKSCQITIDLKVPPGYQYSIADLDYRGYVSLDPGVMATQTASYYFDGFREGRFTTSFRGPIDEDYRVSDSIELESGRVWSPCGSNRLLNIKTAISLRSRRRSGEGLLTVDSVDGRVTQIYGLRWRPCR